MNVIIGMYVDLVARCRALRREIDAKMDLTSTRPVNHPYRSDIKHSGMPARKKKGRG